MKIKVNRELIDSKFETLRRCIERIQSKIPFTLDQLQSDFDLQDIISINLERATQTSVDISSILLSELEILPPETMAEGFDALLQAHIIAPATCLEMKKAVGFRNLIVYQYKKINWAIVYEVATKHPIDFKTFAREVDSWLKKKK